MKALSIRQPWASLIAFGIKTIENRSWSTSYRGPILLHAGRKLEYRDPAVIEYCKERGIDITTMTFESGGIVGVANICGCVSAETQLVELRDRRWFEGKHGFIMAHAKVIPLVPSRGRLGLYKPDDELTRKLQLWL